MSFANRSILLVAVAFCAATTSCTEDVEPVAAEIVFIGDEGQGGVVGTPIVPGPKIEIRDSKGVAMPGVAFTVAVAGGGTLDGAPRKTIAGVTPLGTWTLGTSTGIQSLIVASEGVDTLIINAIAVAASPATATAGGMLTSSSGRVGQVAAPQPQIRLFDAFGNPVSGFAVTVQIAGGGSVQYPNPETNANGIASAGAWTLGTTPGTQRVTLTGGNAPSIVYTATVDAGIAASAVAASATTGNGVVNTVAPISPSVRVTDQYGNGIAGVVISVAIAAQSGGVTTANPVTNANGVATVGTWTLGALVGAQSLTMTATGFPAVVFTVTAAAGLAPAPQ